MRSILTAIAAMVLMATPVRKACAQEGLEQGFVHSWWTVDDGLPVNAIRSLAQTPDGFVWLATIEGVVRFDGNEFVVFNSSNTPAMSHNRVSGVGAYPDGRLIIGTELSGLTQYHPYEGFSPLIVEGQRPLGTTESKVEFDGTFQIVLRHDQSRLAYDGEWRLSPVPPPPAGMDPEAWRIGRFQRGSIGDVEWLFWGDEGRLLRSDGQTWVPVDYRDGQTARGLTKVYADSDGSMGVIDGVGMLAAFDGRNLTIVGRIPDGLPLGFSCLVRDGNRMHIGYNSNRVPGAEGMYVFRDGMVDRISRVGVSGCLGLLKDSRGNTWLGWDNGLSLNGKLLSHRWVEQIIEGSDGAIWIAAADGLHRYAPMHMEVMGEPEGLVGDNVYTVFEDSRKRVWISAWQEPGQVLVDGRVEVVPFGWDTMVEREDGSLWTAAARPDIYLRRAAELDLNDPDFGFRSAVDPDSFDTPGFDRLLSTRLLFEDRDGRLWVGSDNGLYLEQSGRFRKLFEYAARTIAQSPDGAVWVGTAGWGLYRYRGSSLEQVLDLESGFASNFVRGILRDPDHPTRLWISTEDSGLIRLDLDEKGDIVHRFDFTRAEGLFQDGIHITLEDDFGRLWMNTNFGVFWVWKDDLNAVADGSQSRVEPTVYTEREGLRNREGNGGMHTSGMKGSDGRMWFPGQGGVSIFDPADLSGRKPPTPVVLGVMANGQSQNRVGGSWTLAASDRDFTISFTAPEFTAPERLIFETKLEGYRDEWQALTGRVATFTNLSPGDYTFRVRVRQRTDAAPEATAVLRILPFWYETWWFYGAAGLGLVLGLSAVPAYRLRRARVREEELNQVVRARTRDLEIEKETTERQAAELRELNRAKSRFFANVSHEFRTPLTLIIGPLRQILENPRDPQQTAHELMMRNAEKLLGMVNRILQLAKLESKTLPFDPVCADLARFAAGTASGMVSQAERAGVTLHVEQSPPVFSLFDPALMDHVVTNLISNALKFTEPGGHVFVSIRDAGDSVFFEVRDTGIGIPDAKLPFVFDRFYQVDTSSTRRYEGTGIGLSLVRELVTLHSGHVHVESREGHGSTFSVRLPKVPLGTDSVIPAVTPAIEDATELHNGHPATEESGPSSELDVPQDSDHPTVLVVDDNEDIRTFLRGLLAPEFAVAEAVDGDDALARIEAGLIPDVIVTDIMMPHRDGLELNRALKANPDTDTIPVIFLTALAEDEHRLRGILADADLYLAKPLDGRILVEHVRGVLRRRSRLLERLMNTPAERSPAVNDKVGTFEARVRMAIDDRLTDSDLSATDLADAIGLSYSQLHRRLKSEAGVAPTELIRRVRVERAAVLLEARAGTVSEIAYAVGFNSLSYFNRCFRAEYDVTPSRYAPTTR